MSKRWSDHQPEYTEGEQQRSLISRRIEAFESRSRQPGDAATWVVVLGALMCTLLMVCYSVAGLPLMALAVFGITIIWFGIMGRLGRVNVFSILWGAATTDAKTPPNEFVVFQSTAAISLISLVAMVVDAFRGWDFTWYGYALLLTTIVFLVVYVRSWILPVSRL